jgi:hypothetical protein
MTPLQTLERLAELQKDATKAGIDLPIEAQGTDFAALAAYVERLEEGLRFYADETQWSHKDYHLSPWALLFSSRNVDGNGYEIAQAALGEKP